MNFEGQRALTLMTLQPISYRGRLVACATARRWILCGELDARPPGDPERTFVIYMCAYAGDVLRGELPGPYTDRRARAYARAALIPDELLERPCPNPQRTSIASRRLRDPHRRGLLGCGGDDEVVHRVAGELHRDCRSLYAAAFAVNRMRDRHHVNSRRQVDRLLLPSLPRCNSDVAMAFGPHYRAAEQDARVEIRAFARQDPPGYLNVIYRVGQMRR